MTSVRLQLSKRKQTRPCKPPPGSTTKKPDPLPLIETCRALGTAPARTLMIGDSSNDAFAARAAGCPVVLMTYGYNHGEPVRGVDADGFADTMTAVAAGLTAQRQNQPRKEG